MLVNIILDVRDPDDTSTEEGKAEADEAWQMRMHWRSEFMRAGLYDCVEVGILVNLDFDLPKI